MNNLNNNQQNPKWSTILLGFGDVTIGADGCVISVLGDAIGTTPDVVNALLKAVGGFTDAMVVWDKIAEAFPGVTAVVHDTYDNAAVLQALANGYKVLVFVSAAPIGGTGEHCVEYIGNEQCKDPWSGEIRPTSFFPDVLGEWVELQGTWQQATTEPAVVSETTPPPPVVAAPPSTNVTTIATDGLNTHGIDPTNIASLQVVFDTWFNVSQGLYEPITTYNALKTSYTTLQDSYNELQSKYESTQQELTTTNSSLKSLTESNYNYGQEAVDANKLVTSYEQDLTQLYALLDISEDTKDPIAIQAEAVAKITAFQKAQAITPREAEKTLSQWEEFFLKIAQSALNNGLNDYLKSIGKQIVDLDGNPNDANIGDSIVTFLEAKFKDASLVTQVQAQMQSMKENIAKTQPFLVKLGYAIKNLIFVK